jgi:hypothetical protein
MRGRDMRAGNMWRQRGCSTARLQALLILLGGACTSDDGDFANDASGGSAAAPPGSALCGALDEACCRAPLPACGIDLECDSSRSTCVRLSPPTACGPGLAECTAPPEPSRLCQGDGDCAANETCCPAGALGICVALQSSAECPRSDLALAFLGNGARGTTYPSTSSGDCRRSCYDGSGSRRVLEVGLRIFNVGNVDAVLGTPDTPGTQLGCEPYVEGALFYELRTEDGTLVRQVDARLRPGCREDELPGPTQGRFSCELLGLERGYYEDDVAGCPGLDISGVPGGRYTLGARLELDPESFPDTDTSNNRIEVPVTLLDSSVEFDPTAPCLSEGEIVISDDRVECGWTVAPVAECSPGEPFVASCSSCTGEGWLRLCDGDGPCLSSDSTTGDLYGESGACPVVSDVCSESGAFTPMLSALDPIAGFHCDLTVTRYQPDPLMPCAEAPLDASDECGWAMSLAESCVPGELVAIGCVECDGSPVLRACSGDGPCLRESDRFLGLGEGHTNGGVPNVCPVVAFICPPEGSYTTLVSSADDELSYACSVERVDVIGLTDPCSQGIASGLLSYQGCGWTLESEDACTPGEAVSLSCVVCEGEPDLRICDDSAVCIPSSRREIAHEFTIGDTCPQVSFDCPASGRYSAWVTPFSEVESDACSLFRTP